MAKQARNAGLDKHKVTDATKLAAMSSSFSEGKHIELEVFPAERAMLYKLQVLNDEVKELHRYLSQDVGDGAKGDAGNTGPQGPKDHKDRLVTMVLMVVTEVQEQETRR